MVSGTRRSSLGYSTLGQRANPHTWHERRVPLTTWHVQPNERSCLGLPNAPGGAIALQRTRPRSSSSPCPFPPPRTVPIVSATHRLRQPITPTPSATPLPLSAPPRRLTAAPRMCRWCPPRVPAAPCPPPSPAAPPPTAPCPACQWRSRWGGTSGRARLGGGRRG